MRFKVILWDIDGTLLKSRSGGLVGDLLTAISDKLIKSRHLVSPFLKSRLSAG